MTKVYIYDITNCSYTIDEIKDKLRYQKIKSRNKYSKEEDLRRSYIAYLLLQKYLKDDFNITDSTLEFDLYQKPYIKNIYFNITHSNNIIGVIISNKLCGIDIEYIDYHKNYDLLAKKILSTEEYNIYISLDKIIDKNIYFIKCFTQKEAYLKAVGTGIILSMLKEKIDDITSINIKDDNSSSYVLSIYKEEDFTIKKDCKL